MANTIKNTTLLAGTKEAIVYFTLVSDGSEETDLAVYDSSAIATSANITDPLDCTLLSVYGSVSAAATARVLLEWDATTDVLAIDIPAQGVPIKANFRSIGGLPNQGGSGKTGDITLTTTGLESGDAITLILHVRVD